MVHMNFFKELSEDDKFYYEVKNWVLQNKEHEFFLFASHQKDERFYTFTDAVLQGGGTPILIISVGAWDSRYPWNIQKALDMHDSVRVYEVSRMGMMVVLKAKAQLFIKTNGGILWERE